MPELRCASPGARPRALAKPDVICGWGLAQTAIPTLLRVRAAGYVVCLAKRVVCVVGSCHRHRLPDRLPFIVRQNFLNYLDCLNLQSTGRVRNKRRGKLVQDHIYEKWLRSLPFLTARESTCPEERCPLRLNQRKKCEDRLWVWFSCGAFGPVRPS